MPDTLNPNEAGIPQKAPYVLELQPGEYYWCRCGRSDTQPFCSGAHKGTGFTPLPFTITEKKTVALCGCKRTGTQPFCDGTHRKL
jgi:CDGSH-type Zn-finger protein